MATGGEKSEWMKVMKAELTCAICLEIYNNPVTLRCGHSFCHGCVMESVSMSEISGWSCPICEVIHNDNKDWSVNSNLQILCERYKDLCHGGDTGVAIDNSESKQEESEVHVAIKKRLNSLDEKIQRKYESTTQFLDGLSKVENTLQEKANELKHEFADLVDNLKSVHLEKITEKRTNIDIYLKRLQLMIDDSIALNLEVKANQGSDNDANVKSMLKQIRALERDLKKSEVCKAMLSDFEVQLHEMSKTMNEWLTNCYLITKKQIAPEHPSDLTGFLTMDCNENFTAPKDWPLYSLGSCEKLSTRNWNTIVAWHITELVRSHLISGKEETCQVNMKTGECSSFNDLKNKFSGEAAVRQMAVDGKGLLAINWEDDNLWVFRDDLQKPYIGRLQKPILKVADVTLLGLVDGMLCYTSNRQDLILYSISEGKVFRVISTPTRIFRVHLRSCNDDIILYTLEVNGRVSSFPLYNNGDRRQTMFDVNIVDKIKGMAADHNGNLWILTEKNLRCFGQDRSLMYVSDIDIPLLANLDTFGVYDNKLIFVRTVVSRNIFLYTSLEEL